MLKENRRPRSPFQRIFPMRDSLQSQEEPILSLNLKQKHKNLQQNPPKKKIKTNKRDQIAIFYSVLSARVSQREKHPSAETAIGRWGFEQKPSCGRIGGAGSENKREEEREGGRDRDALHLPMGRRRSASPATSGGRDRRRE